MVADPRPGSSLPAHTTGRVGNRRRALFHGKPRFPTTGRLARGAAAGRPRPGLLLLLAAAAAAVALSSCGRTQETPLPDWAARLNVPPAAPVSDALQAPLYPALSGDPQRLAVLQAYLGAWNQRQQAPQGVAPAREPLLAVYAEAYRTHHAAPEAAGLDGRLRLLWDLSGLAHTTVVPPAEIKRACTWTEPLPLAGPAEPPVVPADLQRTPALVSLERLPRLTSTILSEVRLDSPEQQPAGAWVRSAARGVYFTAQLPGWSPNCPMDVCGSSEPLTRLLILTPVSNVDLTPKADWSLAAVAVHEAAHVAWFHRPEVSADPRLLLPVPNEREAWRRTAQFLRGLLRAAHPEVRAHVQAHGADVRAMLQQARAQLRTANPVLGLAEDDESELTALPGGISEADLRAFRR